MYLLQYGNECKISGKKFKLKLQFCTQKERETERERDREVERVRQRKISNGNVSHTFALSCFSLYFAYMYDAH